MHNLNMSVVRLSLVAAVFLATASVCDAGERGRSGVAQEGGESGYHCSTAAGYPKLDSTLEILAVEHVRPFCCFLLPVLAHSGQSARCPVLGIQRQ